MQPELCSGGTSQVFRRDLAGSTAIYIENSDSYCMIYNIVTRLSSLACLKAEVSTILQYWMYIWRESCLIDKCVRNILLQIFNPRACANFPPLLQGCYALSRTHHQWPGVGERKTDGRFTDSPAISGHRHQFTRQNARSTPLIMYCGRD